MALSWDFLWIWHGLPLTVSTHKTETLEEIRWSVPVSPCHRRALSNLLYLLWCLYVAGKRQERELQRRRTKERQIKESRKTTRISLESSLPPSLLQHTHIYLRFGHQPFLACQIIVPFCQLKIPLWLLLSKWTENITEPILLFTKCSQKQQKLRCSRYFSKLLCISITLYMYAYNWKLSACSLNINISYFHTCVFLVVFHQTGGGKLKCCICKQ